MACNSTITIDPSVDAQVLAYPGFGGTVTFADGQSTAGVDISSPGVANDDWFGGYGADAQRGCAKGSEVDWGRFMVEPSSLVGRESES